MAAAPRAARVPSSCCRSACWRSGWAPRPSRHDVGVVSAHVGQIACLNRRLVAHGKPRQGLTEASLEAMYGADTRFFHHHPAPASLFAEAPLPPGAGAPPPPGSERG